MYCAQLAVSEKNKLLRQIFSTPNKGKPWVNHNTMSERKGHSEGKLMHKNTHAPALCEHFHLYNLSRKTRQDHGQI